MKKFFGGVTGGAAGDGAAGVAGASKIVSALNGATTFKAVHRLNVKIKEFETKLNQIQTKTDSLSAYHLENFGSFSMTEFSKTLS